MAETTTKTTDIKVPVAESKKKECEDCRIIKQQIELKAYICNSKRLKGDRYGRNNYKNNRH